MRQVVVSAKCDNLRSRDLRFLQEVKKLGNTHVLLWDDESVRAIDGKSPDFPQEERQYFVESVRFVDQLSLTTTASPAALPAEHVEPGAIWAMEESHANPAKETFCREHELDYCVIPEQQLRGFPESSGTPLESPSDGKKKVLVTGCYDWFHSGHVRFFEEVSDIGDLYVVVGHDENIKLLKGDGHPMYSEDERRYMAGSIRYVKQALVSTGNGWLDAEPEIERIRPDIYAVNEDGDHPEKRDYCVAHGIEYRILKRLPKEGLPKRQSTDLRGF